MMLESATWTPIEPQPIADGSLYVTHSGALTMEGLTLKCWQLSNGTRMLDAQSVAQFFGFGSTGELADDIARLGNQELAGRLRKPIEFTA